MNSLSRKAPGFRAGLACLLACALVGGLTASLLAIMSPTAARAARTSEVYQVPRSGTFQLTGKGFGHGIGMSQFGAEGMGRLGKGYREIVRFYYPGTTLDSVSRNRKISVGLSGVVQQTAQGTGVALKARADLQISHRGTLIDLPGRAGGEPVTSIRVVKRPAGLGVFAASSVRAVKVAGGLPGSVVAATGESIAESRVSLTAASGASRKYRGVLRVVAGSSLLAVNRVLLEHYLRSVVSSEVPSSWTPAALRAQAVAARSYALLAQSNARVANRAFDICDTSYCQVYSPIRAESAPEVMAVRATAGKYLQDDGAPVMAMFGSANGGYSVAGGRDYLVAQQDPYDGVVEGAANWGHSWTDAVGAAELQNAWPQIGRLEKLKVLSRDGNGSWGGRVESIALVGSKSTVRVSADSFRWATGLKSTWWTVSP